MPEHTPRQTYQRSRAITNVAIAYWARNHAAAAPAQGTPMQLPRFLRDFITSTTLCAYGTVKGELRADVRKMLPVFAETISNRIVGEARENLRHDFDRVTLFGILFRSQADQSRRLDSVDATLGVLLTALLVLAPIAFEKAPTWFDRAIALGGFGLVIAVVGHALFFVGGREPDAAALGAKLLGDLQNSIYGTLEQVIIAINRTAADPRHVATKDEMVRRGAAGDLVELIAEDRRTLRRKRRRLAFALILFLALAATIGWRDVLQSPSEDSRNGAAHSHRETLGAIDAPGYTTGDPESRRVDLRPGHAAAGLALFVWASTRDR
jgi:hypothetical protein